MAGYLGNVIDVVDVHRSSAWLGRDRDDVGALDAAAAAHRPGDDDLPEILLPIACVMFLGAAMWIAGIPALACGISGRAMFGLCRGNIARRVASPMLRRQ